MAAAADPRVAAPTAPGRSHVPAQLGVALVATRRPRRARGPRRRPCAGARPAAPGRSGCPASSARPGGPAAGRATSGRPRRQGWRRPAAPPRRTSGRPPPGCTTTSPGAEPQQGRQPGHQLLGADRRQHRRPGRRPVHRDAANQPDRRPRAAPACRGSAGSRARRRRPRAPGVRPRGWGRPACRPTGRRCRPGGARRGLGERGQPVPGEVRQPAGRAPLGVSARLCSCGGSAAISGWSLSILPSLAAPPGEPRSSKNSTFAL